MENRPSPPQLSPSHVGMTAYSGRSRRLYEELRALLKDLAAEVRQRWQRSLPVGDYLVDRWERAQELGFGKGASIYDSALVIGDVSVGHDTWIGPFTILDGSGGLVIGDFCSISAGVQIYTHDTVQWATTGGTSPPTQAPVRIGSRCYIGPNVVISKGVTIGEGCIVGANSLVNSDLPADVKAWGTPARVVGRVNDV